MLAHLAVKERVLFEICLCDADVSNYFADQKLEFCQSPRIVLTGYQTQLGMMTVHTDSRVARAHEPRNHTFCRQTDRPLTCYRVGVGPNGGQ